MPRPSARQPFYTDGRDKIARMDNGPNDPCRKYIEDCDRKDDLLSDIKGLLVSMRKTHDLPISSNHQQQIHKLEEKIENELESAE